MKKLSLMIVAAGLLTTSLLTSCKKEEIKANGSTHTPGTAKMTESLQNQVKDLNDRQNQNIEPAQAWTGTPTEKYRYVMGWFDAVSPTIWWCNPSSDFCITIVYKTSVANSANFISYFGDEDEKLRVEKHTSTGLVTHHFDQVDETIDGNGNSSFVGLGIQ